MLRFEKWWTKKPRRWLFICVYFFLSDLSYCNIQVPEGLPRFTISCFFLCISIFLSYSGKHPARVFSFKCVCGFDCWMRHPTKFFFSPNRCHLSIAFLLLGILYKNMLLVHVFLGETMNALSTWLWEYSMKSLPFQMKYSHASKWWPCRICIQFFLMI